MARIFLSSGEPSGERYAIQLMAALRRREEALHQQFSFFGLGGKRMQAEGFERIVRSEDVNVMGITEILRHVPRIYREYRKLRASLAEKRPDLAILIDFPDVNLGLAKRCKQLGIPVLYFVGPQVWAWKQHRLRRIRRDVDRMLVIFPFEEPWYRERGVTAKFVGHPLSELPAPTITREEFAQEHGLYLKRRFVALLPGSRPREIALNLPAMLAAAAILERERPTEYEFLLPLAPGLSAAQEREVRELVTARSTGVPLIYTRDARATMLHARASVVASGTATVEAALIGNPFVVVYRLSGLSYEIAKRFVRVPHVAMANLIAGKRVVPELIQDKFTAGAVAAALKPLLDDGDMRETTLRALAKVGASLQGGQSAVEAVADEVYSFLHPSKHPNQTNLSPSL